MPDSLVALATSEMLVRRAMAARIRALRSRIAIRSGASAGVYR
jgi:hypothetical protein